MNDNSFDSEEYSFDSEVGKDTDSKSLKDEQSIPNQELITAISSTLETLLEKNKKLQNLKETKQSKICFWSNSIPKISLYDYLIRIQTYSCLEKNTLILSLIYIDRLCKIGNFALNDYNVHRILFTAILMAIKFNEDNFYDNNYYAEIGGIKAHELKTMEYTFIKTLDFNMYVSDIIFDQYNNYLNHKDKENKKLANI